MKLTVQLICGAMLLIVASGSPALGELSPHMSLERKSDYKELEKQIQKVVADMRKTVVSLRIGQTVGSGTIISEDGWVATAAHVPGYISGKGKKVLVTLEDNRMYQGEAMGATSQASMQHGCDYGLIKVDTKGDKLPVATLGESGKLLPGDWLVGMGHPYGLLPGRGPVVRAGRMLGLDKRGMIVTDTPFIHGDSGGPIFDLAGAMIAFVSNHSGDSRFITPVDGFKAILDRLKAGEGINENGNPSRGIPGLSPKEQAQYVRVDRLLQKKEYADAVTIIAPLADNADAPVSVLYDAARALSLRSAELEGKECESLAAKAVEYLCRAVKGGWVDHDAARNDDALKPLRQREDFKAFERELRQAITTPLFGIEIDETERGVEVAKVIGKSPAALIGIEVGDIIKRIGDRDIDSAVDYANALAMANRSNLPSFEALRGSEKLTMKWNNVSASDLSGQEEAPEPADEAAPSTTEVKGAKGAGNRKDQDTLLKLWDGSGVKSLCEAVFTIRHKNGDQVALATAVREDGYLITKASEISEADKLEIVADDGTATAVIIIAQDREADIALLKADITLRSTISFDFTGQNPVMGTFLADIGADGKVFSQGVAALNEFDSNIYQNLAFLGLNGKDHPRGGLSVKNAIPGSPADVAGFQKGDMLLTLNGEAIENLMALGTMINSHKPGDKVTFEGQRDGKDVTFEVTLVARGDVVDSDGQPRNGENTPEGRQTSQGAPGSGKEAVNGRADGFGLVIRHDGVVLPDQCGAPIIDLDGNIRGLNIARADCTCTFALPAKRVNDVVKQLLQTNAAE